MLNVLITVDTEIWPLSKQDLWSKQWNLSPESIEAAFNAYILGPTEKGNYGLPKQLELLGRFNCRAVFFVEPLFSRECGDNYLERTVGLISDAHQDVELHLHPEWNEKGRSPLVPGNRGRHMWNYSRTEQELLISEGIRMLCNAGANETRAFRAGGYQCDMNTLAALGNAGVRFDSSFNSTEPGRDGDRFNALSKGSPFKHEGVCEIPVTVFEDWPHHYRHAQLGACSFSELRALLLQAWKNGLEHFVIVSHSFELLTPDKRRPDPIVVRRFEKLLRFLDNNRDKFRTTTFEELSAECGADAGARDSIELRSNPLRTGIRIVEQGVRRLIARV